MAFGSCFAVAADGVEDGGVVDDEVAGSGVLLYVVSFACGGCAGEECDMGVWVVLPFVVAGSVDASVVAFAAGGSEVVGIPPCAALAGGDYVIDFCGVGGAAGVLDLAGVVVSFEDLFADASPCAAVFGFSGHWVILVCQALVCCA